MILWVHNWRGITQRMWEIKKEVKKDVPGKKSKKADLYPSIIFVYPFVTL